MERQRPIAWSLKGGGIVSFVLFPKLANRFGNAHPGETLSPFRFTTTSIAIPMLSRPPPKRSFASQIRSQSGSLTLGTRVKIRFPEDSQPPRGRQRRSGVSFLPRNEIWRSSRGRNARLNRFRSRGLDHPPGACSRYSISSGERGPVQKDRRATVPPWKARERPRSKCRERPRTRCRSSRGCQCPHCRDAGQR